MSHDVQVSHLPSGFLIDSISNSCPYAAISHPEKDLYSLVSFRS
ncbi:hypothetical protein [Haloplasma contractile]|nr:hypothetical protein [Haloplasma contractile]